MPGLLVHDATEIAPGELLLRVIDPVMGQRSLTPNLDPKTAQPGDLPNSCVDFTKDMDGIVRVVFLDGTDLDLDPTSYVEAAVR